MPIKTCELCLAQPAGTAVRCVVVALCAAASLAAQSPAAPDIGQLLERLDRLEEQNRELATEIHKLRTELAAREPTVNPPADLENRLEVQESRTAEQAQTKVEASHKFPIRLTGMVLFNSFLDSSGSGGVEYPTVATNGDTRAGGGSLRQTIIGLDYLGPRTWWGGTVSGSLRMDLWGGSGQQLDQYLRLRTGTISIDWKTRHILAGVDKPLISPRDPESLAQVAVGPLTGAGNLWFWNPQVRFEQDFPLGDRTGLRAQVGVIQTHEVGPSSASPYAPAQQPSGVYFEPARPGVEGRLEFFTGSSNRFELGSGFHHSVTHAAGVSLPSDVYTLDWLVRPWSSIDFTGAFFIGQNVAPLGTGAISQGFLVLGPGQVAAVHSQGGWGQLTWRAAPRLWFNLFSGQQDDRHADLAAGAIGRNLVFGANVFYRLAPNVLASFEASQIRTVYIARQTLLNNHYDLALAYLF
jgi:hypothetical protein